MKNLKLITIIVFLFLSVSSYSQLKVNSSGNVGIGVNPASSTYELKVLDAIFPSDYYDNYPAIIVSNNEDFYKAIYPSVNNYCALGTEDNQFAVVRAQYVYGNGNLLTSDRRLKENFRDIENPLEKLLQVKGLKYDFIKQQNDSLLNEKQKQKQAEMRKDRMGFVAQDLEKLFPEAVLYDKDEDMYYIEYNAIIPVIVEAMKEQQTQIEELKSELNNCCESNLKSGTINNPEDLKLSDTQAKLYQNTPNPFNAQTSIRFEIPETVQNAQLHICNMTGTLLKTITVNKKGEGNVTINANEFAAGMYLYSLVCDGKIVDTKQMLLTE